MDYKDALTHLSHLDETTLDALSVVFHEEAMEQMARSLEAHLDNPPDYVEAHRAAIRCDVYDRCINALTLRVSKAEQPADAGGLS